MKTKRSQILQRRVHQLERGLRRRGLVTVLRCGSPHPIRNGTRRKEDQGTFENYVQTVKEVT
jgi:hypothetical protein